MFQSVCYNICIYLASDLSEPFCQFKQPSLNILFIEYFLLIIKHSFMPLYIFNQALMVLMILSKSIYSRHYAYQSNGHALLKPIDSTKLYYRIQINCVPRYNKIPLSICLVIANAPILHVPKATLKAESRVVMMTLVIFNVPFVFM